MMKIKWNKETHDFNCTQANDMIFPLMAEKTRYLKENPKGVSEVCKQMEDLTNVARILPPLQVVR